MSYAQSISVSLNLGEHDASLHNGLSPHHLPLTSTGIWDQQSCAVTDRSAKSISEIYFVEERLFTFNTFTQHGSQKKCCRYLCKENCNTSTVPHKRTIRTMEKLWMTGSGLNTKEKIKQYVLMTNWTIGLTNANKAQKIFMPTGCSNLGIKVWAHRATKIVKLHPYKIIAIKPPPPPNGEAVWALP